MKSLRLPFLKNQLKGSWTPAKCKTSRIKADRKIHGTHSPQSFPQAQCGLIWRKLLAPTFFLGRKREDWNTHQTYQHFRGGLPRDWFVSSLSPSAVGTQQALQAWEELRTQENWWHAPALEGLRYSTQRPIQLGGFSQTKCQ